MTKNASAGAESHRAIWAIALPMVASNVSTPLLGLVDTGVVGQIPDPVHVGAVALGGLIFSLVFWTFGFLRMGTTGLTAQAVGAADPDEVSAALGRAVVVALIFGGLVVLFRWPIGEVAFALIDGTPGVEELARRYYDIRIWSAPATLTNYALLGWFIGCGRTRVAFGLQLLLNGANMILDVLFVMQFKWGVEGVAAGTVLAQVIAAGVGILLAVPMFRGRSALFRRIIDADRLRRTLAVNRDIMIRTISLVVVFVFFTAKSAEQGDVRLAANTILMQLVSTSAYFLDGLAFAAEVLVGHAVGARDAARLRQAMVRTTGWAAGLAAMISVVFLLGGPWFIDGLTVDGETRRAARDFLMWAAWAPLVGVWAFQLDGIFIGATRSAEMRNAMIVSFGIFLLAWWALRPFGNDGLWAALYVHYAARLLTLLRYVPRFLRDMTVTLKTRSTV